jgi:16S rRNA (guanine527-N7)-methyltransferase
MQDDFKRVLIEKLAGVCELSRGQIERLEQHYALLIRWNRTINLTSIWNLEESVERHYCESVFAAIQLPETVSAVDVGSGAGFPGIPIAIMREDCSVMLVESHRRKAAFLKEASRELRNVRVMAGRVEELAGHFDWAVSRAVQFSDIAGPIKKLADNVEVLSGGIRPDVGESFEWRAPIPMPWGDRTFIWIGRVSRET